jgi:hypothetical protein
MQRTDLRPAGISLLSSVLNPERCREVQEVHVVCFLSTQAATAPSRSDLELLSDGFADRLISSRTIAIDWSARIATPQQGNNTIFRLPAVGRSEDR